MPASSLARATWPPVLLALCAAIAAGCSHMPWAEKPPETAQVTQELSASASVVAVDPKTRLITLRDAQGGGTFTVQAGPQVRNFDQIRAGDSVNVRYMESLAVALAKPGTAVAPPSATIVGERAAPWERPGMAVGGQITTTVKIESVDTKTNIVVFTPPGGGLRAIRVRRPEGQRFIAGLKPGDDVQITYTEAMAVGVEKQ